jgi:hypothetical protein
MSYRKFFMLIAFAPFVLLLLGGDALAQCFLDPDNPDCDSSAFGFWGPGGGGSTISCKIGFGDTVLGGDPNNGTVTIQSVPGKTLSCTRSENTTNETGQGQIVGGIQVTGVQAGQCNVNKSTKTSEKNFFAQCGQGGNVDGDIQIAFPSGTGTWSFGGVDALGNTGACNNSNLFPATGAFLKNQIFTTTVRYNNTNCQGTGNDGKANFRSCTGTALNDPTPECVTDDTVHTVSSSLDQIITFGLDCQRLPVNQTSCQTNSQGIIKATIDGATTNTATIDQNSIRCGNPDDPFFSTPQSVTTHGNDLIVSCFRCFQNTYVPGPENTLVVTANQADGSTINHIVGGLCSIEAVSG